MIKEKSEKAISNLTAFNCQDTSGRINKSFKIYVSAFYKYERKSLIADCHICTLFLCNVV